MWKKSQKTINVGLVGPNGQLFLFNKFDTPDLESGSQSCFQTSKFQKAQQKKVGHGFCIPPPTTLNGSESASFSSGSLEVWWPPPQPPSGFSLRRDHDQLIA